MIKLNASFSKKVPAEQEYSSIRVTNPSLAVTVRLRAIVKSGDATRKQKRRLRNWPVTCSKIEQCDIRVVFDIHTTQLRGGKFIFMVIHRLFLATE